MTSKIQFSLVFGLIFMIAVVGLMPVSASAGLKKKLFVGHKVLTTIEQEVVRHRLRIVAEIKRRAAQMGDDSLAAEIKLLESARDSLTTVYSNADDSVDGELDVDDQKNADGLRAMARSHLLGQYLHQLRAGFDKVDATTAKNMEERLEGYDSQIQDAADLPTLMPSINTLEARLLAYKGRKKIAREKSKLVKEIEGDARTLDDGEKIFGGIAASPGRLLEVVAIRHLGGTCTGTLIGKRVVLTAAHCVCTKRGATKFTNAQITIGNRAEEFSQETSYRAIAGLIYHQPFCRTFINQGFTRDLEGNDLALLYLDRAVTQTKPVGLIDPVGQYLRYPPRRMKIAGFGWTETGTIGVKMQARVDVADAMCASPQRFGCRRGEEFVLQDRRGRKIDTCQGDSGGPVFYIDQKLRYLAGVTSRAAGSGGCGDGGIYTLLTPGVVSWLNVHMSPIN